MVGSGVARLMDAREEQAPRPPCASNSSFGSVCKHEAGSVLHAPVTTDATVFECAGCECLLVPTAKPDDGPGGASEWIEYSSVGCSLDDKTHS